MAKGPHRAPDGETLRLLARTEALCREQREMLARHSAALRLLEDSAIEYRRMVIEWRCVADCRTVSSARRIARRVLDSIA